VRTETKNFHNPKTDVWARGKICSDRKKSLCGMKKSAHHKKTFSTGANLASTLKQMCGREQKFDTVLILGHRQSGKTSTAEKQMLGREEKFAATPKQN